MLEMKALLISDDSAMHCPALVKIRSAVTYVSPISPKIFAEFVPHLSALLR